MVYEEFPEAEKLIKNHGLIEEGEIISVRGIELEIAPNVFCPHLSKTSKFFIENINLSDNSSFLEIGIGTGFGLIFMNMKYNNLLLYGTINNQNKFGDVWNSKERIKIVKNIKPVNCYSCRHSDFNIDVEKLYKLEDKIRDNLSEILSTLKTGKSLEDIQIPDELHWLQNGLKHFELVNHLGYNKIMDFPVYRRTKIVGS